MTKDIVETVARAVYAKNDWWRVVLDHDDGKGRYRDVTGARMRAVEWEELDADEREDRLQAAQAAIAAHQSSLSTAGYVTVKREVLEPFAALGGPNDGILPAYHDCPSDCVVYENSGMGITAGDVRLTRRALGMTHAPGWKEPQWDGGDEPEGLADAEEQVRGIKRATPIHASLKEQS